MFQEGVKGIMGLSSILNAHNNKKATKYIARENKKIAEMQFDYNKKEISRAFDYNLKSVLREQANERIGAVNEARTLLSNINMSTGNNANVESESFEYDIKDKTSKNIADNMLFMLDTQKAGINELVNTKVAQTYNLGLNYENALSSINNKQIALNQKYLQQTVNGIADIATAGMSAFQKYGGSAEETESNGSTFMKYNSNAISNFGLQSYNPYKKNYGF